MNFFSAEVEGAAGGRRLTLGRRHIELPADIPLREGDAVTLGVRPEHLCLAEDGHAVFEGEVDFVERLGNETIAYLTMPSSADPVAVQGPRTQGPQAG